MPKIKVKGQTVQTGERPQTNGHTHAHTRTLPNVLSPLLRGRLIIYAHRWRRRHTQVESAVGAALVVTT